MMDETSMTNEQIRAKGLEVLAEKLGPVGMARFLQQTETGWGDYSKDRHDWLGNPAVRNIAAQIKANKKPTT
jgi:hypothetical protein